MARSYAVTWRTAEELIAVGELELGAGTATLTGVDETGRTVRVTIACGDLAAVEPARNGARLRGRRTVILVSARGARLAIASLDAPGSGVELLEQLAGISGGRQLPSRPVVGR